MPSVSPYVTIEEWEASAAAQRAAARGVARLIADTLRHQFPGAAYLVLTSDPEHEPAAQLFPHSIRDETGAALYDFEDHLMPPVEHGTPLSAAWWDLSPATRSTYGSSCAASTRPELSSTPTPRPSHRRRPGG